MNEFDLNEFARQFNKSQRNLLEHSEFTDLWKKSIKVKKNCRDVFLICNDLNAIIENMEDYGDNKEKCNEIFAELKDNAKKNGSDNIFEVINIQSSLPEYLWYNTTAEGINLRPGLMAGRKFAMPAPLLMADENVHGVTVGRTGAGKSVFLNNLLINMMIEYAPWELELYLIDFKKVELSKYVTGKGKSPHVRACAATGEVRYAISLIEHIRNIMEDRETLFSRLGFADIKDFRKQNPDVVMPRIVLVADEFQQLFLYATGKQSMIIQDLLTAITRKGRATGVHLFFASQEMQGTGIQMSNFKVRFALPCSADVSSAVIGNSAAAHIKNPDADNPGYVILNTGAGTEEENKIYMVPFLRDNIKTEWLHKLNEYSNKTGFIVKQKYYLEEKRPKLEALKSFLEQNPIKSARSSIVSDLTGKFFTSLFLGRSVVYNSKKYDIENINIERGKSKNILVISPDAEDLAYMQNLFAINFSTISYAMPDTIPKNFQVNTCFYSYFDLNPAVSALYPLFINDVKCDNEDIYKDFDKFKKINYTFLRRKKLEQIINGKMTDESYSFSDFFSEYSNYTVSILDLYLENCDDKTDGIKKELYLIISNLSEEYKQYDDSLNSEEDLLSLWSKINSEKGEDFKAFILDIAIDCVAIYCNTKFVKDRNGYNLPVFSLFTPYIIFFSGIDTVSKYSRDFREFINSCMDVNMYCIFFSSSAVDIDIKNACNYFFVGGLDNELYEKYIEYSTSRTIRSITIEARIKSISKIFAFKKYKTKHKETYSPELDIDKLMFGT